MCRKISIVLQRINIFFCFSILLNFFYTLIITLILQRNGPPWHLLLKSLVHTILTNLIRCPAMNSTSFHQRLIWWLKPQVAWIILGTIGKYFVMFMPKYLTCKTFFEGLHISLILEYERKSIWELFCILIIFGNCNCMVQSLLQY